MKPISNVVEYGPTVQEQSIQTLSMVSVGWPVLKVKLSLMFGVLAALAQECAVAVWVFQEIQELGLENAYVFVRVIESAVT